jgi:hypothetical protein
MRPHFDNSVYKGVEPIVGDRLADHGEFIFVPAGTWRFKYPRQLESSPLTETLVNWSGSARCSPYDDVARTVKDGFIAPIPQQPNRRIDAGIPAIPSLLRP